MTLDTTTRLLLGQSVGSQLSPPGSKTIKFMEAFDFAVFGIFRDDAMKYGVLYPLGVWDRLVRMGKKNKYEESCEHIKQFVEEILDQRLNDFEDQKSALARGEDVTQSKYVFLKEIVDQTQDRNRIRDELVSVLFAGRDSTGSLLSNTVFMLARRPDAWARLRQEIWETFGGERPTDSQKLGHMKFMKCVLNESMGYPFQTRRIQDNVLTKHQL
jgi:cytochrome P450